MSSKASKTADQPSKPKQPSFEFGEDLASSERRFMPFLYDTTGGFITKIPNPTEEEKSQIVQEIYLMHARELDKLLEAKAGYMFKQRFDKNTTKAIKKVFIDLGNCINTLRLANTQSEITDCCDHVLRRATELAAVLGQTPDPVETASTLPEEPSLRQQLIEHLQNAENDDEVANILNNYHPHVGEMTIINEYLKKVRLILETERGEDTSIYATLNDLCQVITNAAVWMWQRELKNDYKSDDATTMLSSRFAHLQDTVEKCLATIMYGATHYRTVDETERLLQYLVEVIIGYLQGNQSDTEDTESSATFTPIDQPENSGVSLKEMVEFLKKCEIPTENIPKAVRALHNLIEQMSGEILPPSPFGGPESLAADARSDQAQRRTVDTGDQASAQSNQEKAQSECRGFKELRNINSINWDRMRKQLFNEFRRDILEYGSPAMKRFCFNCNKLGSCSHYENVMRKRLASGGIAKQSELADLEVIIKVLNREGKFNRTPKATVTSKCLGFTTKFRATTIDSLVQRQCMRDSIQTYGSDMMKQCCAACFHLPTCQYCESTLNARLAAHPADRSNYDVTVVPSDSNDTRINSDFGTGRMAKASDERRRQYHTDTLQGQIMELRDPDLLLNCFSCSDLPTCEAFAERVKELKNDPFRPVSRGSSRMQDLLAMLEKTNVQSSVAEDSDCEEAGHRFLNRLFRRAER